MKNGVLREACEVVDTLQIQPAPHRLAAALDEVTRPETYDLLAHWSDASAEASALFDLGSALLRDPSLRQFLRPLSRGTSARNQLIGELDDSYLLAILIEQVHPFDPQHTKWMIALRTWLLVKGIAYGRHGNVRDKLVRTVCRGVRLACDHDEGWGTALALLAGNFDDLGELNSHLSFRTPQILQYEKESFSNTHRPVLSAIARLAEGHEDPDPKTSAGKGLRFLFPQAKPPNTRFVLFSGDIPEETDEPPAPLTRAITTQSGRLARTDVAPHESYSRQRNESRSVFLLAAADLHFLPWSWDRVAPFEEHSYAQWNERLLDARQLEQNLLGAFLSVSESTGRSLARIGAYLISNTTGPDWRITPTFDVLHRLPPSRENDWTPRTDEELMWVASVGDMVHIRLKPKVSRVLKRQFARVPAAACFADLWAFDKTPRASFFAHLPADLERLTPGMVGNTLHHRLFDRKKDPLFARVIASSPQSGLPGACAYANWTVKAVEQGLNGDELAADREPVAMAIGGGSRLDPLDRLIWESVERAATRLRAPWSHDRVLDHHNAYVAYLTADLSAGTGIRPGRDPIESLLHIDFDRKFIYVDEKSSGGLRSGRLVPFPEILGKRLDRYRRYLVALSQRLHEQHTELATAVAELTSARTHNRMPFLFMLVHGNAGLTWASVGPEAIRRTGLFDWPLPANLFRQRLTKVLRRDALDPEIIDGIFGHAEFGCATYADDSTRVWEDDMGVARPHIERAYTEIAFPDVFPPSVEVDFSGFSVASESVERPFGVASRKGERAKSVDRAKEQATAAIAAFRGERDLTALSEDELWQLSKQLLLTESGMPRSTGYERYQVLTDQLDEAWQAKGRRALISRRFTRLKPPASPFTEFGARARGWHEQALASINRLVDSPNPLPDARGLRALAATLLCLEARIADPAVLMDVASGVNFRITRLQGKYDLEHSPSLVADDPDCVVQQFPISARLAGLLTRPDSVATNLPAARKKSAELAQALIPTLLDPVSRTIPPGQRRWDDRPTYREYLRALASRVDQVNVQTLPGVLAAWYSGRIVSGSLDWRDRIRLSKGASPIFESDKEAGADPGSPALTNVVATSARSEDQEAQQRAAWEFIAALRAVLPATDQEQKAELTPTRRRDLATNVDQVIREWNGRVAAAMLVLGQWISALIKRETGNRKLTKLSAVSRYLAGLAPAFRDIAHSADLHAMDDEEITALYYEMIESRENKDTRAFADRLGDFHRWARTLGVEDPDWGAMPVTVTTVRRSPGLLGESDYLKALELLIKNTNSDHALATAQAFVLFAGFRFGLRRSEALGLARDDLVFDGGSLVAVIVRSHSWRGLKTKAARRIVPLVFTLTEPEKALLATVITRTEARVSKKRSPLFPGQDDVTCLPAAQVAPQILSVLKAVTGHPGITLHHARHSAVNYIASSMLDIRLVGISTIEVAPILLGREGPTRSASWALARYLGHAGTRTVWQSYLHIHNAWARTFLALDETNGHDSESLGPHLIDLEVVELSGDLDTNLLSSVSAPASELSVVTALQFLLLISRGKRFEEACIGLGIKEKPARKLFDAAFRIGKRMKLAPAAGGARRDNADGFGFLRRINASCWDRLLHWAASAKGPLSLDRKPRDISQSLDVLVGLVGETGQLLVWRPDQVAMLVPLISESGLSLTQFFLRHTTRWSDDLDLVIRPLGKASADPGSSKGRYLIDGAPPLPTGETPSRRASLIFAERNDGVVRNRLEVLPLLLSVCAAGLE